MLTGYIGSATFLNSVSDVVDRVKALNPDIKYFCDPVLGDMGKLYAPVELIDLYKTKIVPKAYCVSPNYFEAELLTGIKIVDEETALQAMLNLHEMGPKLVVISSTFFLEGDFIVLFASNKEERIKIIIPKLGKSG